MSNVVLASTSPRRKELLEQIGLAFEIVAPDFEEVIDQEAVPTELVEALSIGKARSVATHRPDAVVIGSDTLVAFDGQIIGKPSSPQDAIDTLKRLRTNKCTVHTGWAVMYNGEILRGVVDTDVYMGDITDEDIIAYVATGEPLDKAGSCSVNGIGAVFIDRIDGSIDATIGLPLRPVARALKTFGVPIF